MEELKLTKFKFDPLEEYIFFARDCSGKLADNRTVREKVKVKCKTLFNDASWRFFSDVIHNDP